MNGTVKMMGQAALVPLAVLGIRYAWKAVAPSISEAESADRLRAAVRERMGALKWQLDGSGASRAAEDMLRHDRATLRHAKAGEAHKWRAVQARLEGTAPMSGIGNALGSTRGAIEARLAARDAAQAKQHKAAALASAGEAEQCKRKAIAAWLRDTSAMLQSRFGALAASVDTGRLSAAGESARELWAEHGWGLAREEREARKRRSNLALGAVAGLGIGVGAAYLLSRRNRPGTTGNEPAHGQGIYYTGNGQAPHSPQHAVDRAMRQTEASLGVNGAVTDDIAPREPRAYEAGSHEWGAQGTGLREWGDKGEAMDTDAASEPGETWIVIPKEQWAEFIQRMSDSHQGWLVRVETEGNLSMDEAPVNDQRFSGMQLEPSLARPGVRIFGGSLPQGFFEHVVPDLRAVEHLPSDEDGYQGLRLATTMDRVTVRFTDPGDARDPLAE